MNSECSGDAAQPAADSLRCMLSALVRCGRLTDVASMKCLVLKGASKG